MRRCDVPAARRVKRPGRAADAAARLALQDSSGVTHTRASIDWPARCAPASLLWPSLMYLAPSAATMSTVPALRLSYAVSAPCSGSIHFWVAMRSRSSARILAVCGTSVWVEAGRVGIDVPSELPRIQEDRLLRIHQGGPVPSARPRLAVAGRGVRLGGSPDRLSQSRAPGHPGPKLSEWRCARPQDFRRGGRQCRTSALPRHNVPGWPGCGP